MIAIWCAAGPAIGLGHLSRCATLAAAFERAGLAVELLVECPSGLSVFGGWTGVARHRVETRAEAWAWIMTHKPVVLITDLLQLARSDSLRLRALGVQWICHLNDSGLGDFQPDLAVDTDLVAAVPSGLPHPVLSGGKWHMIRPDVASLRPIAPWQAQNVQKVLVVPGGADPGRVSEALLASWPPALDGTLVLGPAMAGDRRQSLAGAGPLTCIEAPDSLAGLMLAHDLVITLGGLTSYEAFCLGRPVACVAWSYMGPYVAALAAAGVVVSLGSVGQAPQRLADCLADPASLSACAAAGYAAIDGQGAGRVVAWIRQRLDDGGLLS